MKLLLDNSRLERGEEVLERLFSRFSGRERRVESETIFGFPGWGPFCIDHATNV